MEPLKPCPFCGEAPKLSPENKDWRAWVKCDCGCEAGFADTDSEAIAAWNHRTPDPWVAQVREALESVANGSQLALDAPLWRLSESVCDKIRIALAAMPQEES